MLIFQVISSSSASDPDSLNIKAEDLSEWDNLCKSIFLTCRENWGQSENVAVFEMSNTVDDWPARVHRSTNLKNSSVQWVMRNNLLKRGISVCMCVITLGCCVTTAHQCRDSPDIRHGGQNNFGCVWYTEPYNTTLHTCRLCHEQTQR